MTRGGSHCRSTPVKSRLWFGTDLNVVFPKHKGFDRMDEEEIE